MTQLVAILTLKSKASGLNFEQGKVFFRWNLSSSGSKWDNDSEMNSRLIIGTLAAKIGCAFILARNFTISFHQHAV
jgi:hypothetical protein